MDGVIRITDRQRWLVSAGIGALVAIVAIVDLVHSVWYAPAFGAWVLGLLLGGAVATMRMRPALALGLSWAAGLAQIAWNIPLTLAELALLPVLFCAARWGSRIVAILAGLTNVGALIFIAFASPRGIPNVYGAGRQTVYLNAYDSIVGTPAGLLLIVLLSASWLVGLALRYVERARKSAAALTVAEADAATARQSSWAAQQETTTAQEQAAAARESAAVAQVRAEQAERLAAQATEIARLREEQNRLTRDVHDVVGHSLTVILAQAESAQFLADDDVTGLKATMRTVATAARASLQDVRDVLTPGAPRRTPARLEAILSSVADMNGRSTEITQVGSPRPLPPELDEVACRVLQEMLTNALRHGAASGPLRVELAWPDDGFADSLRIEVVNDLPESTPTMYDEPGAGSADAVPGGAGVRGRAGRGIGGMRRRLESVGGRLDVRRREGACDADVNGAGGGGTFTAAAIVPVRDVGARTAPARGGDPESSSNLDAEVTVAPAASASTQAAGDEAGADALVGAAPDRETPAGDTPTAPEVAGGGSATEPRGSDVPGVDAPADGPGPDDVGVTREDRAPFLERANG